MPLTRRCRPVLIAMFAAFGLAFGGCQKTAPLDQKVSAENAREFSSWQNDIRRELATDDWKELEAMLQEIKLRIIALREASGADAVNDALRPKIHGKTVREVLQQGYDAKLWRLNVEREEFEKIIAANATLRTKPGDAASSSYLERKQKEDRGKLERVKQEIRAAEERKKALAAAAAAQ